MKSARLTSFCRRLEAATSRLEDMATSVDPSHPSLVSAIENENAPPTQGHPNATNAFSASPPEPLPRSIVDFDNIIREVVGDFVAASEKIGGLVEQQVCHSE